MTVGGGRAFALPLSGRLGITHDGRVAGTDDTEPSQLVVGRFLPRIVGRDPAALAEGGEQFVDVLRVVGCLRDHLHGCGVELAHARGGRLVPDARLRGGLEVTDDMLREVGDNAGRRFCLSANVVMPIDIAASCRRAPKGVEVYFAANPGGPSSPLSSVSNTRRGIR